MDSFHSALLPSSLKACLIFYLSCVTIYNIVLLMMKKIVLFGILCIGLTALVSIDRWQVTRWRAEKQTELDAAAELCRIRLENAVISRFNAVEALSSLFAIHPETKSEEFAGFAAMLLKFNPPIRALQYADSQTRVIYVYPPEKNETTISRPMTLLTDSKRGPFTEKAIAQKAASVQGPFELRQGGTGLVVRSPIFSGERFIGLAIGVYDVPVLIREAFMGINLDEFAYRLADGEGRLFWGSDNIVGNFQEKPVRVADTKWTFALGRIEGAIHPPVLTRIMILASGGGFLLSSLLLIHFFWAQTRRLKLIIEEKTENLSESNRSLINEISERKRAEKNLKKSETHLRTLIDSMPDLVWLKDSEGVYLSCNSKFERFFGAKEADIIGKTDYDFVDEKTANFFRENDKIAMAAGKPSMNEEVVTYADDGHTEILETLKSPIYDHNGKLVGVLGVGRDITRRKEEEEEKIKLKTELQQVQKMESIGRLAGGVAHDFNNMLSIIQGNTDMLIEDTDPLSPAIDNLHEIQKAADRSVNLTRQLLAFARKQTIAPKVLNFNKAVEGMLKMLSRLIGEDIKLEWVPSETLWPIKIDPSQIDQVLANFCVNARDAIKGVGKVTIETENVSFDEAYCRDHTGFKPGDYVMMAFSDDGCGMDNNTLENIFEPFFTTKGAGQGTGLGLATIYGIVKQNSGFINVYSEPGQGTTFKIYFPRYNRTIPKAEIPNSEKTTETGHETILLVEDEKAILRTTSMMLERLGYRVLPAATPGEAVRIAEESGSRDIHLLITDVVMPEMNGRDLSKRILHLCPGIKCIFMSGYTANVIAHHGVLDDGVEFLNKPFSKQELASRIREVLDQGK